MTAKKYYSIKEIATIIGADPKFIHHEEAMISTLGYDSRKLHHIPHTLFFAVRGRRNGHDFINHAYLQGIRCFVMSDVGYVSRDAFPDANFLIVDDTLRALQDLSAHHRTHFSYPVLAITGSNGKTIVKDWLYQLLLPEWNIVRSPKSFNSQLGVALSLWEMGDQHDMAIIEAGISRTGEMERLVALIQPDIAVLTNLGTAHQDGFKDFNEKKQEKVRLLRSASKRVFPGDSVSKLPDDEGVTANWSWGPNPDNRLQLLGLSVERQAETSQNERPYTRIRARLHGESDSREITIPFTDAASVENAMTCWAVMLMLDYGQSIIVDRMAQLQVMEMRLEMKQGIHRCSVIDDSYSNDLSSLTIALDFLKQQRQHAGRTLILSDLPQVEGNEAAVYEQVQELLINDPPERLITVGPQFVARQGQFPAVEHLAFDTTEALLDAMPQLRFDDQTILLKGARRFAFERISAYLVAKTHETVLEINLSAIAHNILQFKTLLPQQVKLMTMVKAFSYGSGTFEIANLLQFHGVDYLAVAYADEGVALRQSGVTLPIMVMSPDLASFEALYRHRLEPEIFGFTILGQWQHWLRDKKVYDYPVHLKFDTGMHRLGFAEEELPQLLAVLQQQDQIRASSVFSHLAASGDPGHDDYTAQQLVTFERIAGQLEQGLGHPLIKHIANTDAISRHPEAQYDMVRLGLGMYGLDSGSGLDLMPAMQLKTTITQLRDLSMSETVGYSRKGLLQRNGRIATVKIGYADGYDRRFGNGCGKMWVSGRQVPTIGDICMDMCMLDVTGVPDVREGDEVLVYGDVQALAASIDTIPYELMVGISQRVKRVYYHG